MSAAYCYFTRMWELQRAGSCACSEFDTTRPSEKVFWFEALGLGSSSLKLLQVHLFGAFFSRWSHDFTTDWECDGTPPVSFWFKETFRLLAKWSSMDWDLEVPDEYQSTWLHWLFLNCANLPFFCLPCCCPCGGLWLGWKEGFIVLYALLFK